MRERNGVGADVLGDAAGLAGGDVGLADDIQQRGLAVVNVAHDGDDRGAGFICSGLSSTSSSTFLIGAWTVPPPRSRFSTSKRKPYLAQIWADLFLDGLVDAGKNAQLHQVGDDLERLALELLGQVAHDDGRFEVIKFAAAPAPAASALPGAGEGCTPGRGDGHNGAGIAADTAGGRATASAGPGMGDGSAVFGQLQDRGLTASGAGDGRRRGISATGGRACAAAGGGGAGAAA
jgi:hypothetical protein